MKNNKKVSAIVVLILVLIVGGYLVWSKKNVPVQTEETSNWKTYTNTDPAFSFNYPASWKEPAVNLQSTRNWIDFGNGFSVTYGFYYNQETATNTKISQLIESSKKIVNNDKQNLQTEDLRVDGHLATKITYLSNYDNKNYTELYIYQDNKAQDKFIYLDAGDSINSTTFNQIISTFKFAEPNTETTVTILVPENLANYEKAVANYVQVGGPDPRLTWKFIKKEVIVSNVDNIVKASAEAAAEVIQHGGGPAKASIAYFEVKNDTAYVLLDIDLDGWAGVSVSIAEIHPLVENTLLLFPEIKHVVFGYVPKN